MYYLLHDSPTRWEDYLQRHPDAKLPMQLCSTRWLEDVPVAQQAIAIWQYVSDYVQAVSRGPKKAIPTNKSFQTVLEGTNNPLVQWSRFGLQTLQPQTWWYGHSVSPKANGTWLWDPGFTQAVGEGKEGIGTTDQGIWGDEPKFLVNCYQENFGEVTHPCNLSSFAASSL